jgi:protein TonB
MQDRLGYFWVGQRGSNMTLTGKRLVGAAFAICSVTTATAAQRPMMPVPIGNPGTWITADDYPPEAVRANRSGRVVADVDVGSDGKVISCKVSESSGTTSLDLKTCEIVMERGRFNPATDLKGRPTAGTYHMPVNWLVPDSAPPIDLTSGKFEQVTEFESVIGTDGNIVSCRVITKSDAAQPDPCAKLVPGSPTYSTYVRNGQPSRTLVHYRYSAVAKPAD